MTIPVWFSIPTIGLSIALFVDCGEKSVEKEYLMKAAWDWVLPRETRDEERELVRFAEECGFNTLIVSRPSDEMIDYAHELDLKIFDVIYPFASDVFAREHPECLQRMRPYEEEISRLPETRSWEETMKAYRQFLPVEKGDWYCFGHDESIAALQRTIDKIIGDRGIDGIAVDSFGFKNYYACFCDLCRRQRSELRKKYPDKTEPAIMAEFSEENLLKISEIIYDRVKGHDPDLILTCHIYPPFNPNPYYGNRFRVDYCAQTVAWIYKPFWSCGRIELEIETFKKLEDRRYNVFVPFIGCEVMEPLKKEPERLRCEFQLALSAGSGRVMFAILGSLKKYEDLFGVVRETLSGVKS